MPPLTLTYSLAASSGLTAGGEGRTATGKNTFFHTLAASVMLAATAGLMTACTSNDDNPVETPPEPTDFAPAAAEAVDLGLPSGTKWANMNVGAEAPEDYGLYFAWGETVGYTSDTSDGRLFNWASYKWMNAGESSWKQIKKYQIQDGQASACWYQFNEGTGDYEFIGDGKAVLDLEDDAARANWGGDWRMPTYEDFQELLANTTNEWITVGTVTGRKFTSKTNGNSIFLPAAGYRGGSGLYQSTVGYYWSSTVSPLDSSNCARYLYFYSSYISTGNDHRYYGRSVRPVH